MNKYLKAIGIWFLIIPVAILNGALRESVLNKLGNISLPISGFILTICIILVAYFLIPIIKNCKRKDYIIFGIIWFILTNLFDLLMYISEGENFLALINSYNFMSGNLWILVCITSLISPIVVYKLKGGKNV